MRSWRLGENNSINFFSVIQRCQSPNFGPVYCGDLSQGRRDRRAVLWYLILFIKNLCILLIFFGKTGRIRTKTPRSPRLSVLARKNPKTFKIAIDSILYFCYTIYMKTAISLPDRIYLEAEESARNMGIPGVRYIVMH